MLQQAGYEKMKDSFSTVLKSLVP